MPTSANTKAYLQTEGGDRIDCMFNPEKLSFSHSSSWKGQAMPGHGVPTLDYTGATSGKLTLELFFDTTGAGTAVNAETAKLVKLTQIDSSLPSSSTGTANARPPWVTFHWGSFHSFKAVVTDLSLTFEYFSSSGTPLRARANLTLLQYEDDPSLVRQNPTSGTPFPHRTHRIQPGETLDRISSIHYGDPTRWRSIASANGIEDPLALRPGRLLAIPERA
ncbi:MAG TPA: LysM peptidoglycan-binding domain-containing protein [Acidimicrobiales bacterium]|nr:LysM peptidoglycan-binding domain-containing protein [Acidimicrobiales bacterium]